MSKLSLIGIFSHPRSGHADIARAGLMGLAFACLTALAGSAIAQEDGGETELGYPKGVAIAADGLWVLDLDLPGIWKVGEERTLFTRGSSLLRKPMNRPQCVLAHPDGGVLVGDSATREVYWVEAEGAEAKPLTKGRIGIPMALAISPDGSTLYVGDAEKRATFRLPIEGGDPELVARVNARGFAFDGDGKLLAVTPDANAIQRIDVDSNEVEVVVDGRPFQFPNGLCWAGDHGYVTDTYSNCIWKFTADGKTEKWHEGEPLQRPVGIAVTENSVLVADPKVKQVFEFDRESKESKPRM